MVQHGSYLQGMETDQEPITLQDFERDLGTDPTYKEWKRFYSGTYDAVVQCTDPTYKEWKL